MNSLTKIILTSLLLVNLIACRKPTESNDPVRMEDMVISPDFSWETNRNVEFQITADHSTVITISSEDGKIQYHRGFYSLLPDAYLVSLSLPAYVQKVLVNNEIVTITDNLVQLSLSSIPSLKNMEYHSGNAFPTTGIIAGWKFDENTGSIAYDQLGVNNGAITGYTWTPGISGSALQFDGLGGHVQVPKTTALNPVGDKISFSFWFKMSDVGSGGAMIYQNVKYIIRLDAQGRLTFALYTPSYVDIVMTYSDRILNTDWHHGAAVYDGAMMKLYVDGVLKASGSNTGMLHSSSSDVYIGNQNSINHFKGTIDEVLIYDVALTETEINQIYTSTPNPGNGESSLISYWKLDENSGTNTTDSHGTNNGTITNASWGIGVSGSCLNFNGTSGNVKVLNSATLNPVNSITMMAWAKTQGNLTCKIAQKGDWDGHGIGQGKWDGWNVSIRTNDNTSHLIHWGGGLPVINEWYHLAMTYDGATLKMYVNGQLRNSAAVTGNLKINGRDFSIGSDNNAQKFFNGSIDEVKIFGTALSQTEIQANYNFVEEVVDQDGDGVVDTEDSYPNDPARAFNNVYPAEGFGSLAFEDLWPGKGDYDFNDLVVDYQFTIVTNSANKVTEVLSKFAVRAIGAGFANGFGFQLPGATLQSTDMEVEGSVLNENYITLNSNGLEANQDKPTVIVFDNINAIMPPVSGFGVNVIPGDPYVDPDTMLVNIGITPGKYSIDELGLNNFNPFLIVNKERGKEVHLPNYEPTSLVDAAYFGTSQDDSDPATGKYYKTAENLPWAIKIASSYDYTIESAQITSAHLKFVEWAESSGAFYPDWYLDLSGYRNEANIYQIP
jgi:LruC domain-containing protein